MLSEFGNWGPHLRTARQIKEKIGELYLKMSQYDTLFYDSTNKSMEAFLPLVLSPRGVWMEVIREHDSEVIGALYLTNVLPGYDADGHFTFWDSIASGREPIIWNAMLWVMDRYNLRRISTQIPPHHHGLINFLKGLGFAEEGEKADAIVDEEGNWSSLYLYGMTRPELEQTIEVAEEKSTTEVDNGS